MFVVEQFELPIQVDHKQKSDATVRFVFSGSLRSSFPGFATGHYRLDGQEVQRVQFFEPYGENTVEAATLIAAICHINDKFKNLAERDLEIVTKSALVKGALEGRIALGKSNFGCKVDMAQRLLKNFRSWKIKAFPEEDVNRALRLKR